MGDSQDKYYGEEPTEEYRSELAELRDAAWDFKMMIFAAYAPDGQLLTRWLDKMTLSVRAQIPKLQFSVTHARLVKALAAATEALGDSTQ